MPQFSRDQPGPAPRFRPGPGQLGEHAALQAARPAPGGAGGAGGRRGGSRRSQTQTRGASGSLGLGAAPGQDQQPDQSHLVYGLRHANAVGLGRDLPFGLWAVHNGYFSQLAPDKQPVDWFDA